MIHKVTIDRGATVTIDGKDIEPILPMQKPGLTPKRKFPMTLLYFIVFFGCFLLASYLDGCDTPAPATTSTSK